MRNAKLAPPSSHSGFSVIDLVIVIALVAILTALAVPQMINQRRLLRSAAANREIVSQLRYARQQAMTQRQVFTFQYDNTNKQISIIDHNNDPNTSGMNVLADVNYPNTVGSVVVSNVSLTTGGIPSGEIQCGIPAGLPTGPLADGISRTPLVNQRLNITFQPDGSVMDVNGNPLDLALFIYNSKADQHTAAAISVAGSAGRIKLWRYDSSVNQYVE